MSWFDRLVHIPFNRPVKEPAIPIDRIISGVELPGWVYFPNDLAQYPLDRANEVREVLQGFATLMDTEKQQLLDLNLPLPAVKGSLTYSIKAVARPTKGAYEWRDPSEERYLCKVVWQFPTFTIPPYFLLTFDDAPSATCDPKTGEKVRYQYVSLDQYRVRHAKSRNHQHTCYCIVGDPETVARAQATFNEHGAAPIITDFPGLWLSRDPYDLFEIINSGNFLGNLLDDKRKVKRNYWDFTPILSVPSYTPAQLKERERKIYLFNNLMDGLTHFIGSETGPDLYLTRWPLATELYMDKIPALPEPCLPPDAVTLKLLPLPSSKPALLEEFFDSLRAAQSPIRFGFESNEQSQFFIISCAPSDRSLIERMIQTFYPEFAVEDYAQPSLPPTFYSLNISLKNHYLPIKPLSQFELDPYRLLLNLLDAAEHQQLQMHIIFTPTSQEVFDYFIRKCEGCCLDHYEKKEDGKTKKVGTDSRKPLALERIKQLQKKQPMWHVAIRLVGPNPKELKHIAKNFLPQYETFGQKWEVKIEPITTPGFASSLEWNLLSTNDLVALAHFPSKEAHSERLETTSMKSRKPPALYTDSPGIKIGVNDYRKQLSSVVLPDSVRDRHCYIIGKTRMGKSTLITHMALQDIDAGRGVGIIDPHGDLVEDILARIPKHRSNDVIYFDAKERDRPLALNPFSVQDEDEIEILAADLNLTFRRLSEAWGERMGSILRYVIHTLLRSKGVSFMDIQTILENPVFRERIVSKLPPGPIANWWQFQFPKLTKDATTPILNRMSQFLLSTSVNNLLSQPDGKLDIFTVMQEQKVLLVNLSQGKIGADNAHLLGSLIVAQLQQAAMRRANYARSSRVPFYLYIDEFQNFISSAFEKILSEAGKYQLCLTLAHQYISQLDNETRGAILGNVGTMILFQIALGDANILKAELGSFEPTDATDIEKYHAFCKPATKSSDTFTLKTLPPQDEPAESCADFIIENSKQLYSTHAKKDTGAPKRESERASEHSQSFLPIPPLPRITTDLKDKFYEVFVRERVTRPETILDTIEHELVTCMVNLEQLMESSYQTSDLETLIKLKRNVDLEITHYLLVLPERFNQCEILAKQDPSRQWSVLGIIASEQGCTGEPTPAEELSRYLDNNEELIEEALQEGDADEYGRWLRFKIYLIQVYGYGRIYWAPPEPDPEPQASEPSQSHSPDPPEERVLRPLLAQPKSFSSLKDQVLHYVSEAEYLSTQQIIELCFGKYKTEASKKANASTLLKELFNARQLRKEKFGSGFVYFPGGRKPNFSDHNLAVRSLYVKICRSKYELSAIKFFYPEIPNLWPDLYAEFASQDGKPIRTFWEYDTGSERIGELETKINRYLSAPYERLVFILSTEERLQQVRGALQAPRLYFAVLGAFSTLDDSNFYSLVSDSPRPFFTNID